MSDQTGNTYLPQNPQVVEHLSPTVAPTVSAKVRSVVKTVDKHSEKFTTGAKVPIGKIVVKSGKNNKAVRHAWISTDVAGKIPVNGSDQWAVDSIINVGNGGVVLKPKTDYYFNLEFKNKDGKTTSSDVSGTIVEIDLK